uniref:Pacifastin domain-containing protein n=1 Tax=Timema shepardi TaxID=629360 RepID=A0A7R9AZR2_TIMSH|nr:unnamed protein product [Timema shepardi]
MKKRSEKQLRRTKLGDAPLLPSAPPVAEMTSRGLTTKPSESQSPPTLGPLECPPPPSYEGWPKPGDCSGLAREWSRSLHYPPRKLGTTQCPQNYTRLDTFLVHASFVLGSAVRTSHPTRTLVCVEAAPSVLLVPVIPGGALVEEGRPKKCEPGETHMEDCNTCKCNNDGTSFACTRRGCPPKQEGGKHLERHTRATTKQVCVPDSSFLDEQKCNTCKCNSEGTAAASITGVEHTTNSAVRLFYNSHIQDPLGRPLLYRTESQDEGYFPDKLM